MPKDAKSLVREFRKLFDELKSYGQATTMKAIMLEVWESDGTTFKGEFPNQKFNSLLSRTPAQLSEQEENLFTSANGLLRQRIEVAKARNPVEPAPIEPDLTRRVPLWCRTLGIPQNERSQDELQGIVGDYLLLRPIFEQRQCVVSHMEVSKDMEHNWPARFRTVGNPDAINDSGVEVTGIIFIPDDQRHTFIAIGKYDQRVRIRCAILQRVPNRTSQKPVARNFDLCGIRLAGGTRINGPVAHRIWCWRIPGKYDAAKWDRKLGWIAMERLEQELSEIKNISRIKEWLLEVPVMHLGAIPILD